MEEAMLDGNLLESWKLWRQTKSNREMEGIFEKISSDKIHKKKFKKGYSDEELKYYLGKIRNRFIKKYDARKQKVYMRAGLIKPKSVSIDATTSRLRILNHHLTSFPLPDNKSFSEGGMIEIVLSMLSGSTA